MAKIDPLNMPFHIVAVEGSNSAFHSGYEDEGQCGTALSRLNTEANRMGLSTIYKMVDEPYKK